MICVLDASAAGAVVFREPAAELVGPILFQASQVLVPPLFAYELANVGRTKVLRHELDWEHAEDLLGDVASWPVRVVDVGWRDAWTLARRHGLTVYDAAYLALAASQDVRLLTLDAQLERAAGRRALP